MTREDFHMIKHVKITHTIGVLGVVGLVGVGCGADQGSTTLQCALRFCCPRCICPEVSRGNPGYSTACTEVVTEMAPGALRFAKGAVGPWGGLSCEPSADSYNTPWLQACAQKVALDGFSGPFTVHPLH
jgi:hypothetical protein